MADPQIDLGPTGIIGGVIDNAISVYFSDLKPMILYSALFHGHEFEMGDHVRISENGVANFKELMQLINGDVIVNIVCITKVKSAHKPSPLDYC